MDGSIGNPGAPVERLGYGDGSITPVTDRHGRTRWKVRIRNNGTRRTVGTYDSHEEADYWRKAANLARGLSLSPTWRQAGEEWLRHIAHKPSARSERNAWQVVVVNAPFIDDVMEDHDPVAIANWFEEVLPTVRKRKSVGELPDRHTIETGERISHTYAVAVLAAAKRMCIRAVKKGFFGADRERARSPIEHCSIENRTPPEVTEGLAYLTADEIEKVLSCAWCAKERGIEPSDIVALADCPHMPFEQRVVFTLQIHQCPREGELAAMRWERCDFEARSWKIAESWVNKRPKNGQTRSQAWIPRAERALRAWWEHRGRPARGLLFPSVRGPRRKVVGEKTEFVRKHGHNLTGKEVVALAQRHGITLTVRHVEVIRSKLRAAADREQPDNQVPYAEGYDWGWADHHEKNLSRLGWARRCGVSSIRFHEFRDTVATHLLSGTWGPRWPIKEVSLFLGHSSVQVTERRYAHLTSEAQARAARSVESDPAFAARLAHGAEAAAKTWVQHGSAACEVESANYLKSLAPEVGLEPTTRRLTGFNQSSDFQHLRQKNGSATASLPGSATRAAVMGQNGPGIAAAEAEAALSILEAVAAGRAVRQSELCRLAEAVLDDPRVRLATELLESGSTGALARARQLAALMLGSGGTSNIDKIGHSG